MSTNGSANTVVDNGEAASSASTSSDLDFINTTLGAGTYYIRVYNYGDTNTGYGLSVSATPFDNTADNITSGWLGHSNAGDYYFINLDATSAINLTFKNLSTSADIQLISSSGNILASSSYLGNTNPSGGIYSNQSNGTYNVNSSVTPADAGTTPTTTSSSTPSNNSTIATQTPTNNVRIVSGTLRADTFTYQPGYKITVFSGNGNVDFGSGARDVLDLSQIASSAVSLNLANTTTGGIVYDPGNGSRVFDAITMSDGSEILFENIDSIKFADKTINLSVTPNDTLFNQQWNLQMMGVDNAWRFSTGSNKVLIGIEDTGLALDSSGNTHPDLRNTFVIGNNYQDQSSGFSHGTLVEGVIAAKSNNGAGIAGINWNSDVEMVNVLGGNTGNYDLTSGTQALINEANSLNEHLIVNLSIAGGETSSFDQLVANSQNNVLFVIASGNGDTNTLSSPASLASKYNNVIAVGASWGTKDYYGNSETPGTRISYSGWWGSNYGDGLTLMAPSEYPSTNANKNSSGTFDFGYNNQFNGTSASTPNVTGVASLVWSANSGLTASQVKSILSQTAFEGISGYDTTHYGSGLVNADAAVRRAIALGRTATA